MTPDVVTDSRNLCAFLNVGATRPITQATLRQWVRRGKLASHGKTAAGLHCYRLGDVLRLAGGAGHDDGTATPGRRMAARHHAVWAEVGRGSRSPRKFQVCDDCLVPWPCQDADTPNPPSP